MNMKHTIELDHETVDQIVVDTLFQIRAGLLEDYIKGTTAVFDFDATEDRKQIGEMIKAIEKVIDWHSIPGTVEFDELPTFDA
jgi:hypothetical protein